MKRLPYMTLQFIINLSKQLIYIACYKLLKIMILRTIVINEYDEEVEKVDTFTDVLEENEIIAFLNKQYGKNKWLGYNIESK